ncbi:glycosyltransferase family 2 protein [Porphyromonas levii]|uniref:glycosyltransferase family 2 protein n=1 Tax=Porphyromonas levii TaxID=28114 RepID=UPI001B8CCA50|nr:glycosyltransferase [Porphyromonas levii]MBR8702625.1 Undecaprenyl-phosphate 4-deoxy-4-formamido-L-arabinose transferase [Porphyromonas levii]MBR8730957.1 Undecaprenyl-phosphate 4-deoxy-4-formamido-L-arabinose transferase [Porphyromonas levii]
MDTNHSPFLSIIVPVYNVEKYLNECVDSILGQDFTDFELILVDDGSPDNCPAICDEYAEKDNRVIVIHKENGGLSSARNAGIDICKGEYIWFIDSDDYIYPGSFAAIADTLLKHSVDCLKIGTAELNEDTGKIRPRRTPQLTEIYSGLDLYRSHPPMHSFCFIVSRRAIYTDHNLFFYPKLISEDIELEPKFYAHIKRLKYLQPSKSLPFCYIYRQRSGSISHTYSREMIQNKIDSWRKILLSWEKIFDMKDPEIGTYDYYIYHREYCPAVASLLSTIFKASSLSVEEKETWYKKLQKKKILHHLNFSNFFALPLSLNKVSVHLKYLFWTILAKCPLLFKLGIRIPRISSR